MLARVRGLAPQLHTIHTTRATHADTERGKQARLGLGGELQPGTEPVRRARATSDTWCVVVVVLLTQEVHRKARHGWRGRVWRRGRGWCCAALLPLLLRLPQILLLLPLQHVPKDDGDVLTRFELELRSTAPPPRQARRTGAQRNWGGLGGLVWVPAGRQECQPTSERARIKFSMTDLLGSASCCDRVAKMIRRCSSLSWRFFLSSCRPSLTWAAHPVRRWQRGVALRPARCRSLCAAQAARRAFFVGSHARRAARGAHLFPAAPPRVVLLGRGQELQALKNALHIIVDDLGRRPAGRERRRQVLLHSGLHLREREGVSAGVRAAAGGRSGRHLGRGRDYLLGKSLHPRPVSRAARSGPRATRASRPWTGTTTPARRCLSRTAGG